jgi:peptidoglycan/LPS O-acetylase OafA/YrhL
MGIADAGLSHPKYRADLDGLRAIAVLSVVAYHALPDLVPGGLVGVDVFFVISGFLISTIIFENLERGTFSFATFYARRVKRIFPALVVVLFATYAFGWFALLSREYEQLGRHMAAGSGFVSNLMLRNEVDYYDSAAATKPLLHLWSLAVEEQFYAVWPAVLWLLWKTRIHPLLVIGAISAASFALSLHGLRQNPAATFYLPQARFWELLSGSALAWAALRGGRLWKGIAAAKAGALADAASIGGLLLIAAAAGLMDHGTPLPGVWALAPVAGTTLLIATRGAWANRAVLSHPLAVWFGLISYPLYLWHWPLLSFAQIMAGETPAASVRLAAVVLAIALAWMTYRRVESPVREGPAHPFKVAAPAALMVVAGLLGLHAWSEQGLASRRHIRSFEALEERFAYSRDLGRPGTARIILIGDSHAAGLVPGLKKLMGDSVADYTSGGCIPFHDVDRYDSRGAPGLCVETNNDYLVHFEQSPHTTGLIVSSMGPLYLIGAAFKGMNPERVTGQHLRLISHPEITDPWEIYRYAFTDTLQRLTAARKKVLYVLDVPELGFDPRTCFESRPLVLAPQRRPICAVSREEHEARSARYRALVRGVLRQFPDVMAYDPADAFCDERWCWAARDGKVFYRDADHLTNDGSELLVAHMTPLLAKLF